MKLALPFLLALVGCASDPKGSQVQHAAPTASTSGGPATGAQSSPEPPPATVVTPTHVDLSVPPCESEASRISFEAEHATASEFVVMLGMTSGITLELPADLAAVTVSAKVEGVPWDCVASSLAAALGARVELREGGAAIVR